MSDFERIEQLLIDEEDEYYDTAKRQPHTRLTEAVDLRELLENHTAQFQVQYNEDAALEEQNSMYKEDEQLFNNINLDCLGPVVEDPEENSGTSNAPGETPFSLLGAKMINLTEDGKVKKRVISEGYGEVVPSDSLVWIDYNSYIEFAEVPFDSSYLRGQTTKIRLGQGACIAGLDTGISSMKTHEKAQFLIHYDYAYGTLGVPPRIPPESEILIVVELKRFVDNAIAMKLGHATVEEIKDLSFDEVYKGALGLTYHGNTSFNEKKYSSAIKRYKDAVHCIVNCDKPGPEEDEKHKILLSKLYGNIAVCYNKISKPRQAINAARDALYYKKNHPKAFYQLALAKLALNSYDEAWKFASLARHYAPHNPDINTLLMKIENKVRIYKETSVSFAKNMFSFNKKDDKPKKTESVKTKEKEVKSSDTDIQKLNSLTESNEELPAEIGKKSDNYSKKQQHQVEGTEELRLTESKEEPPVLNDKKSDTDTEQKQKVPQMSKKSSSEGDCAYECMAGLDFELEVIKYIEDFLNDPREVCLPLPYGLTYEELKFVRNQARNYGLVWQQGEKDGKRTHYLAK